MGLFDSIMGRSKPVRPDLDAIFGLPSAAITLSASLGFDATGTGAVAFRVPEGRAFAEVQQIIGEELPSIYFVASRVTLATSPKVLNPTPAALVPHLLWSADTLAAAR